jgi:hypothetical protein
VVSDVDEVEFVGPYRFIGSKNESVLTAPIGKKKGVYLWTIPFQNGYLTYYVGETGVSFAVRSMQHIQNYLNGLYRLYDLEEFHNGERVLVWGGMWKPGRKGSKTMYEFLQSYSKFAPLILDFIQGFRLFLAPIEGNRRIRQRIEAAIAGSLNSQSGVVRTFQDKDIRYAPRRSKEEPIKVKITIPAAIMGLENELEI